MTNEKMYKNIQDDIIMTESQYRIECAFCGVVFEDAVRDGQLVLVD